MSFEIERTGQGVDLVVTGDWSPAAREVLESGLADGLVLNQTVCVRAVVTVSLSLVGLRSMSRMRVQVNPADSS